jgi:hypothetical protein
MKTKRTTKKKPTNTAAKLADLNRRTIVLEANHESLCETLRTWQARVDALEKHTNLVADASKALGIPESDVAWAYGKVTTSPAPPEPVIPKGWKRTTKGNAALKDDKHRALYKNSHLGEWHADWHACHDADRFYIYLARDYPERHQWWQDMEDMVSQWTLGQGARFRKEYSRREIRWMVDNQGDWIFDAPEALCQASAGECMG